MTHAPADHPSAHLGCDTFRFLMFRWCKTLAAERIAADPTAAELHPTAGSPCWTPSCHCARRRPGSST